MSVEIVGAVQDLLTFRFRGTLTEADLRAAQHAAGSRIRPDDPLRILILLEDFGGWERGGQWDDFSFQAAHDQDIARMAIVGDPQWRDLALLFAARDLRPFPIEYFPAESLADARVWLTAG